MQKIGKSHGVTIHTREKYYASSKATNSEFFENLSEITDSSFVLYSPVTSPLISYETINSCIDFLKLIICLILPLHH